MADYKLKKYKSGLTLITVPIKSIETVTVLVLFRVGSKQEGREIRGVSHFLEHMMFKGTKKRPDSKAVSEALDRVGGEYNAFTGKEYTGYYAKTGANHLDLALDWTADIVVNSKLEAKKMNKERGVIIEEMNMYEDTPMQHISDVYEETVWGDQPAGWEIIGTRKAIETVSRKQMADYKEKHYNQENCVVCVCGKLTPGLEKKVEKFFKGLAQGVASDYPVTREEQGQPCFEARRKKTDQSHCMIGFRSIGMLDPRRHAFNLMSIILGGGMSSRLFLEIREKRGLAYYVQADSHLYADAGYLAAQAGVENKNFEQALEVILKEFAKLKKGKVEAAELTKAKEYIKGQTLISMESSNAQAFFYGIQYLLRGKIETVEQRLKKIEKVSRPEIQQVAREFFRPERLNVAVIGPQEESRGIKEILTNYN